MLNFTCTNCLIFVALKLIKSRIKSLRLIYSANKEIPNKKTLFENLIVARTKNSSRVPLKNLSVSCTCSSYIEIGKTARLVAQKTFHQAFQSVIECAVELRKNNNKVKKCFKTKLYMTPSLLRWWFLDPPDDSRCRLATTTFLLSFSMLQVVTCRLSLLWIFDDFDKSFIAAAIRRLSINRLESELHNSEHEWR